MTDTYIRWLLIITGVFTAASFGVFLQPVKQVALIYGENLRVLRSSCPYAIGGCSLPVPAFSLFRSFISFT
jgi:hypothetical protein